MSKKIMVSTVLLAAACLAPLQAQDSKLNLNVGGGVGTPLNPSAQYAGISGNFVIGAGYNIDKHNAVVGQFMWQGLPPTRQGTRIFANAVGLHANVNLYALTANYKYRVEGNRFGVYVIGGGGWYYRYSSIDRNVVVPGTVCSPAWGWWGYACEGGYVPYDNTLAYTGNSALGGNAGTGFTIRLSDSGLKFYVEARYHYAATMSVNTQVVPVTFGFQW